MALEGKNLRLLLRKCLDATNGNFQSLLRMLPFAGVSLKKLLLQLVPRQVVYDLTYVFRAIRCRVDHAGDDERELDLEVRLRRPVEVAWHQFARTDRVCRIHYEKTIFGNAGLGCWIQVD